MCLPAAQMNKLKKMALMVVGQNLNTDELQGMHVAITAVSCSFSTHCIGAALLCLLRMQHHNRIHLAACLPVWLSMLMPQNMVVS